MEQTENVAHTPGPWETGVDRILGNVAVRSGDGVVCSLLAKPGAVGDGIRQANARLIASAPALLAACEAVDSSLRIGDESTSYYPDDLTGYQDADEFKVMLDVRTIRVLRAAIAAAKGVE